MVFLAIERTEFWVDDELLERFEELADTAKGSVSEDAQRTMIGFCGSDPDRRMQLVAWLALQRTMTGKEIVPEAARGCDQQKVRRLISAAVKQRHVREDIPRNRVVRLNY